MYVQHLFLDKIKCKYDSFPSRIFDRANIRKLYSLEKKIHALLSNGDITVFFLARTHTQEFWMLFSYICLFLFFSWEKPLKLNQARSFVFWEQQVKRTFFNERCFLNAKKVFQIYFESALVKSLSPRSHLFPNYNYLILSRGEGGLSPRCCLFSTRCHLT